MANPPRVYLDACCLNRPFDDQAQPRVRLEAEAVRAILANVDVGVWEMVASDALYLELERNPDPERRRRVVLQADMASRVVEVGDAHAERGRELETLGFAAFDALHVACAEDGGVDALLTTDDQLLRLARRNRHRLRIPVRNPVEWLEEVMRRWIRGT